MGRSAAYRMLLWEDQLLIGCYYGKISCLLKEVYTCSLTKSNEESEKMVEQESGLQEG